MHFEVTKPFHQGIFTCWCSCWVNFKIARQHQENYKGTKSIIEYFYLVLVALIITFCSVAAAAYDIELDPRTKGEDKQAPLQHNNTSNVIRIDYISYIVPFLETVHTRISL